MHGRAMAAPNPRTYTGKYLFGYMWGYLVEAHSGRMTKHKEAQDKPRQQGGCWSSPAADAASRSASTRRDSVTTQQSGTIRLDAAFLS